MHRRFFSAGALAIALSAGAITGAQATVIGATPGTDFSNNPTTFDFGDPQAGYTLSQVLQNPVFGPAGGVIPGVATTGSARVSRSTINPGDALAYAPGVELGPGQNVGGDYVAFSAPASAELDARTPYLALQFTLSDGLHYGYAEADGFTLARFAYESDPGAGIATGADIEQAIGDTTPNPGSSDVPEPSLLPTLSLALGLIGFGLFSRRRRLDAQG